MKFVRLVVSIDKCFAVLLYLVFAFKAVQAQRHPSVIVKTEDKTNILSKIRTTSWAGSSWKALLSSIDPYVDQHQADPQWILSRLAMYWKKGEHYTQCYLKNETWDYGTGNAPVPTVRLPGMRVWNEFQNVPLEDRIPYNESGDMKAVSRSNPAQGVVIVPYRKSGHLIRGNNNEILTLAEKSAFAYWLTGEQKYARFSADIFNTWLIGTYYMNPVLDPGQSSGGPGGYQPGGILGYYDYEQIHDDLQTHGAFIYDLLYDYLKANPAKEIRATGKTYTDVASTVFKRFVDLGLIRGGKKGNWNINGWEAIMPSVLVLEPDSYYKDGHGREYYLQFFTSTSTKHHDALPDILKDYDPVTGLWSESPGYALNTVPSLLNIATMLFKSAGIDVIAGNPMLQKAAMAVFPWLDARGNIVVFGDGRGGPANFGVFERLLTYYSSKNDLPNLAMVSSALQKGLAEKQYDRAKADWKGLALNVAEIPPASSENTYARVAYSPVHRHIVMKNGNDKENALMFTLYGGYNKQKHLNPNGLALQLYGKGWALAPDASGYESYWTDDYYYHQTATGSNTILPGYSAGRITVNSMNPVPDSLSFTSAKGISEEISFADVSAEEKRRTVAMIRTSPTSGYYVDIFRSNQIDNDYLYHNLGSGVEVRDGFGKPLVFSSGSLSQEYGAGYKYFKNPLSASFNGDFNASWHVRSTPGIFMDMWMKGEKGREIFKVEAPYTNLNDVVCPDKSNIAPEPTPSLIVRQKNKNGWTTPFVAVFEPYNEGEKSVKYIKSLPAQNGFTGVMVESNVAGKRKDFILSAADKNVYAPERGVQFKGDFGVLSTDSAGLRSLYLGRGRLLQNGACKIESSIPVSACLVNKNGKWFYSADNQIEVSLPVNGEPLKKGDDLLVFITTEGKRQQLKANFDKKTGSLKMTLPANFNSLISIERR